jgi:hypothetical protein
MLFNFRLDNPFAEEYFEILHYKFKPLTENKTFEFQFNIDSKVLLSFNLNIVFSGRDHAGPYLELGLLGHSISFSIHDNRHWDHSSNCWEIDE